MKIALEIVEIISDSPQSILTKLHGKVSANNLAVLEQCLNHSTASIKTVLEEGQLRHLGLLMYLLGCATYTNMLFLVQPNPEQSLAIHMGAE